MGTPNAKFLASPFFFHVCALLTNELSIAYWGLSPGHAHPPPSRSFLSGRLSPRHRRRLHRTRLLPRRPRVSLLTAPAPPPSNSVVSSSANRPLLRLPIAPSVSAASTKLHGRRERGRSDRSTGVAASPLKPLVPSRTWPRSPGGPASYRPASSSTGVWRFGFIGKPSNPLVFLLILGRGWIPRTWSVVN